MLRPRFILRLPAKAWSQTQRISGFTSQKPPGRTPPHGPLRSDFGQFIGQAIPVNESAQAPHILQSNNAPFVARSIAATGPSSLE